MSFITLDRVGRWYGNFEALHEVSLDLEPGRIGLLGPNGAGKSTLLKVLLGLLAPSSGTGQILGHPLLPPEADHDGGFRPLKAITSLAHDLAGSGTELRRQVGYM